MELEGGLLGGGQEGEGGGSVGSIGSIGTGGCRNRKMRACQRVMCWLSTWRVMIEPIEINGSDRMERQCVGWVPRRCILASQWRAMALGFLQPLFSSFY